MLATCLAATAGAGCTLLLVSTDGLTGGAVADAPSGPNGEAGDGGGVGVPATEGGTTNDAAVDVAGDGTAPMAFCKTNSGHAFCDDFDDGVSVSTKWSRSHVEGRGMIGFNAALFRSAPRSFASFTPTGTSVISVANLAHDVGTTDRLRFAFDVQVTAPSGPVGDSFATMAFAAGYLDVLWFADGKVQITERNSGSSNIDHVSSQLLPAGSWVRLQIESTPGHIGMTFDGVTVVDATTTHTYQGSAAVSLGLYSEDVQSIAFDYDNVLVDTTF